MFQSPMIRIRVVSNVNIIIMLLLILRIFHGIPQMIHLSSSTEHRYNTGEVILRCTNSIVLSLTYFDMFRFWTNRLRNFRYYTGEVLFTSNVEVVYTMLCIRQNMQTDVWTHMAARLHDDVIKWKQFPRNWPFVRGIHRSPVNSPHKGQWRGALMFSLICAWINDWVNNREAGDLRRNRVHYDVIVMSQWSAPKWYSPNPLLLHNHNKAQYGST